MKIRFAFLLSSFYCISLNAQRSFTIADSNNLFAFKLYNEVKKSTKGNLFFSPFSISTALAMTYTGARNETEKQMCSTLHLNLDHATFNQQYKTYLEKIEGDSGKGLFMGIANSLWISKTLKLLPSFSETLKTTYYSETNDADFSSPASIEQTRQEINSWVEQKTNNKIKELIKASPPVLDENTRLVLINAIYFNGKWNKPFSKDSTKNEVFYKNARRAANTDFMHNTGQYKYYEDSLLQALEIAYSGAKISMLIFLPKELLGLNSTEKELDYSYYSRIITLLAPRKVIVALPKFKATEEFELKSVLASMGMPDAFSGKADFSGISNESLQISAVIHKAFVDVNEEGTEAAAATAVVGRMSMLTRPKPVAVFTANHPFIFVICDNSTGGILFMGKINNPENN